MLPNLANIGLETDVQEFLCAVSSLMGLVSRFDVFIFRFTVHIAHYYYSAYLTNLFLEFTRVYHNLSFRVKLSLVASPALFTSRIYTCRVWPGSSKVNVPVLCLDWCLHWSSPTTCTVQYILNPSHTSLWTGSGWGKHDKDTNLGGKFVGCLCRPVCIYSPHGQCPGLGLRCAQL